MTTPDIISRSAGACCQWRRLFEMRAARFSAIMPSITENTSAVPKTADGTKAQMSRIQYKKVHRLAPAKEMKIPLI